MSDLQFLITMQPRSITVLQISYYWEIRDKVSGMAIGSGWGYSIQSAMRQAGEALENYSHALYDAIENSVKEVNE